MKLNVRFDIQNDFEIINKKKYPLGTNFVNFISLDMKNILSNEIISNLSENNYIEIISKINKITNDIIIPEIIDTHVLMHKSSETIDIQQIKKDLTEVFNTYIKYKELTEFCYFNDNIKNTTLLQKYIYYLHKYKIEKIILPKQTINPIEKYNNDILSILEKKSPYFYFNYECLNINDYMTASFLQIIENNYLILKCKNCGKYFIAYKRTDTYYCDRQSPQDNTKTCKQYGADKAWWVRTKDENDWYNLYRKVYQSFQMKAKRNPNNLQLKKNFDNFRIEANEWKKTVKEGSKTEAEFMDWLQEFRRKK